MSQLAGRWPWSTIGRIDNTWPVAGLKQAVKPDRLRIAISVYPTSIRRPRKGGSRRIIAEPFGVQKLPDA